MKPLDHNALLQQGCAEFAKVRKSGEWDSALLALVISAGKNGL